MSYPGWRRGLRVLGLATESTQTRPSGHGDFGYRLDKINFKNRTLPKFNRNLNSNPKCIPYLNSTLTITLNQMKFVDGLAVGASGCL